MTADGVSGSDDVMLVATVEGAILSGGEEGSKSADVSVGARISRTSEVMIGNSITSAEERGVASGEEGATCVEAGRGATGGEEGMGIAKGEEGGNVAGTDVNEVAGWSNNVSTLLLGNKKSSVATGVGVGVATSKDSDCEVLKKSPVIDGVEVTDGCICDVLTMKKKPSVSDGVAVAVSSSNGCVCEELEGKGSCVTEVGMGVTASLEGTVGGEMEGVSCLGIRVGVVMSGRRKEAASLRARTEVSAEKVGEKSRVRSSSGIVVEGWMGMSVVKGDEGEGRRVGEREGVEGNRVVRGSRLISLDKNGRRKSLDGDGVGEREGGKEAAAVGVADGNGMKSIVESGSRTSSAVVNNISMGTGERTGDVITGDGLGGNKVDAVVSIPGEVTSGSAVTVSKKKSSLDVESS